MGEITDLLANDPSQAMEESPDKVKVFPSQEELGKKFMLGYEEPQEQGEPASTKEEAEEGKPSAEAETKPEEPEAKQEVVTDKPDPTVERIKYVSELLEGDFDSEETIKETLRSLKEKATTYEQVLSELNELKSGIDPRQFFVSEAEMKRQLMLKQFPDYDPLLITKVVKDDFSQMSELEAIRLHKRLTEPDIYQYDSDVDLLLKKELGLDLEEEISVAELDRASQLQVRKMAKEAKQTFAKINAEVKVPDKVNLEAEKQKQLESIKAKEDAQRPLWSRAVKDLPDKLEKIEFKYTDPETKQEINLYEYAIDEDYRRQVEKSLTQVAELLVKSGKEYSATVERQEVEKMVGALKQKYVTDNIGKIMFAYQKTIEKRLADKKHEEDHNPRKPEIKESPTGQKPEAQAYMDKFEKEFLARHGVIDKK